MEYRLGPPRYKDGHPWTGGILKLSEDVRNSVVFLGWQAAGPIDTAPIDPQATGFLLAEPTGVPGEADYTYLVTARHIAERLTPPFVIRVNQRDGAKALLIHIERPEDIDWCFDPTDETADVAVAPMAAPPEAAFTALTVEGILKKDPAELAGVDAGDPACVVGLYHLHSGKQKNFPIVHLGHVAMMPTDERILSDGELIEGYLIQTNAISGCSGSPVFVMKYNTLLWEGEKKLMGYSKRALLLGIWSSSWKVKSSEIVAVRSDSDDRRGSAAPLGMGIVTPASKLVNVLKSKELQVARTKLKARLSAAKSASFDMLDGDRGGVAGSAMANQAAPDADANPRHKEDFTALLNAAARKPKSGG